jgi:hypothetical protein
MWGRTEWVMIAVGIVFILSVLELVRRRRLKEEYSLLWLLAGGVMVVLTVARPLLEVIARALGIHYAPSALFLVVGLVGMALGLHLTAVISTLTDQSRVLAQRVAILEERVRQVERGPGGREQRDAAQA